MKVDRGASLIGETGQQSIQRNYDPVTDMVTYQGDPFSGPDYGFRIPKGWEVRHRFMTTDVMALMPLENNGDSFQENVNIVLDNTPARDIHEYYEIQLISLERDLQNFKLLSESETTIDGLPAKHVTFTHSLSLNVYTFQWYIVYGESAYVITCTTVPGRDAEFRPKFHQIAKSFLIDQSTDVR